jgi:hypothetical protein
MNGPKMDHEATPPIDVMARSRARSVDAAFFVVSAREGAAEKKQS